MLLRSCSIHLHFKGHHIRTHSVLIALMTEPLNYSGPENDVLNYMYSRSMALVKLLVGGCALSRRVGRKTLRASVVG